MTLLTITIPNFIKEHINLITIQSDSTAVEYYLR